MVRIKHECARLALARGEDNVPHCPVCGSGPCSFEPNGDLPVEAALVALDAVEGYMRTTNRINQINKALASISEGLDEKSALFHAYGSVKIILSQELAELKQKQAQYQRAVLPGADNEEFNSGKPAKD